MTVIRRPGSAIVSALLIAVTLQNASAQTVLARVLDGESGQPVIGALVHLIAEAGEAQSSTLTENLVVHFLSGCQVGAYIYELR